MNMWEPSIRMTTQDGPAAQNKTVFDKVHVAKHLRLRLTRAP